MIIGRHSQLELSVTREKDWSWYVGRSYAWVRDRFREDREAPAPRIGYDAVDRTVEALCIWVDSANRQHWLSAFRGNEPL